MERKASDLFVECLEVEGVEYVFGIPGEETLDLNESLANSSVDFVPVRHEQGGAYMADMYGRLTQRAGVCLGHARARRDEPRDRHRGRVPGPLAARRADRPGRPRAHAQGVPPVHRRRLAHEAGDEVERARQRAPHHPRGRAQGVQGRPGPEARPDPHRAARGRDGGDRRRACRCPRARTSAAPSPRPRSCSRRSRSSARRSTPSCWPATASRASARRRRCASSRAPPGSASPRRSWARACSTTRTRARSARSGCSRATTRSRASRTPTS